jgi:uncharacterized protein (DUF362 family)
MSTFYHPSRRQFVKGSLAVFAAYYTGLRPGLAAARAGWPAQAMAAVPDLVIAQGGAAADLVRAAVSALGGIERFVKPGQFVVIKPNFTWGNPPDTASDTSPEVLGAVVALCKAAGAKRVLALDHVLNGNLTNCLERTGARQAVEAAGGEILGLPTSGQNQRYMDASLPKGTHVKKAQVIREILEADVFINVPIAKDHGSSRLTISLKNLMGTVMDRGAFHTSLDQAIADINTLIKSHLIIVDATRILTSGGPDGPGKVEKPGQVIASVDPVAADSYACTLFKLTANDIGHIRRAKAAGLGESDLTKLLVQNVTPGAVPPPQVAPSPTASQAAPTTTGAPRPTSTTMSAPATPTVASTPTPRPILASVPTPTLAASGGAADLSQAAPLVAVPVAALLGFIVWAARRKSSERGGGTS